MRQIALIATLCLAVRFGQAQTTNSPTDVLGAHLTMAVAARRVMLPIAALPATAMLRPPARLPAPLRFGVRM
jgi:hypothetical protein